MQKRRGDLVQPFAAGGETGLGGDSRGAFIEDFLATHEILIRSSEVMKLAGIKLAETPLEKPPAGGDLSAYIASGLSVSRVKSGSGTSANILDISFRGPSAGDCQLAVNAVIEAYIQTIKGGVNDAAKQDLKSIHEAKDLIDKELSELDGKYQTAHKGVLDRSLISLTDLKTRINANEVKRSDLQPRLELLTKRLNMIEDAQKNGEEPKAIFAMIQRFRNKTPDVNANAQGTGEDSLTALKLMEEELSQSLGKDHPQVVAIRRRIDIASKKEVPIDSYIQVMKDDIEEIQSQLSYIDGLLREDRKTAASLEGLQFTENSIVDRRDRLRKRLADLDDREKQINYSKESQFFEERTINPPGIGHKIAPVLFQSLMIAIALGVAGGGGLAYLAELSDKSYRNPEEIRRRLGLAVVGHIPSLAPGTEALTDIAPSPVDTRVVTYHRPKTTESEAYRGVRTALYFSTGGKGHQVIQVTSPNPGDGKSTLCANLAVAIAQSGKKVLLIDCDFRKPRVHKIFGISSDVGLASVINEQTDLDHAIQPSLIPGLSLLPCGPRPANPAELLTSTRFPEVLEEIKKSFDFVLIDTPPLLAVSDPAVVAPRVDGVLLTIRITNKVRPAAERAKETLAALGVNVVGVVVNDLHGAKKGGIYGYGYGYGYTYGYGYKYSYNYAYGYADHYGDSSEDSGVLARITDKEPPFAEDVG